MKRVFKGWKNLTLGFGAKEREVTAAESNTHLQFANEGGSGLGGGIGGIKDRAQGAKGGGEGSLNGGGHSCVDGFGLEGPSD
jgi:hypothetical protein